MLPQFLLVDEHIFLEKGLIGFLWPEDLVWCKYSIANKSASDTTSKKGLTELWSV